MSRPVDEQSARPGPTIEQASEWRVRARAGWQQITSTSAGRNTNSTPAEPFICAVIAAWNEDDIIYALVSHLRQQGVDRILVLDDRSDDDTASEASEAGAEVRPISTGTAFSEEIRTSIITEVMIAVGQETAAEVWWVLVDADEFPEGPDGTSLRTMLRTVPDTVNVIGSHVLDHVPSPDFHYVRRRAPHPYFPLARWYIDPYCSEGHWKHNIFRSRVPGDFTPSPGQHIVLSSDGLACRESNASVLLHHFPIRNRAKTEARLHALLAPTGRYGQSPEEWQRWHATQRLKALDALFAGDYKNLDFAFTPHDGAPPPKIMPWVDLVRVGPPGA